MSADCQVWVIDDDKVYCSHQGLPHAFVSSPDCLGAWGFLLGAKRYAISQQAASAFNWNLAFGEFLSYRHLLSRLNSLDAHHLLLAIWLLAWQQNHRFCGGCGSKFLSSNSYVHHCVVCSRSFYPPIQPCVIVAITRVCPNTNQPQILLARHHRHKNTGIYGLIAGFVEVGETLEMAVHREVFEETGLSITPPTYIASQPWPYPANLMVGFVAQYQSGSLRVQDDELITADFFDINRLPAIPPKGSIAHRLITLVCQTTP